MSQSLEQAKYNLFFIARSFRDNQYHDDFSYQRFYAFKVYSDKIFTELDKELFKHKDIFAQYKALTVIETIIFAGKKLVKIVYPIEVEIPCFCYEDDIEGECSFCQGEIEYETKLVYKIVEVEDFDVLNLTIKEFMERFKDIHHSNMDLIVNPYND